MDGNTGLPECGLEASREELLEEIRRLKSELERSKFELKFVRALYSYQEVLTKNSSDREWKCSRFRNRKERQNAEVYAGKKIAYKKEAGWDKVLRMRDEGMTVTEIARELGISRPTVYSRIREGEKYMELGRKDSDLCTPWFRPVNEDMS